MYVSSNKAIRDTSAMQVLIFTDRKRSMAEDNVFKGIFLFTGGGGLYWEGRLFGREEGGLPFEGGLHADPSSKGRPPFFLLDVHTLQGRI